ncbi:hypothetical protein ACIQUM_07620 [Amycolatopsis azurea]|uniref:hypothetical protein n=1 Tax=Amycolatopsis azurea TaxID=36819 RepID=UPI00382997A5
MIEYTGSRLVARHEVTRLVEPVEPSGIPVRIIIWRGERRIFLWAWGWTVPPLRRRRSPPVIARLATHLSDHPSSQATPGRYRDRETVDLPQPAPPRVGAVPAERLSARISSALRTLPPAGDVSDRHSRRSPHRTSHFLSQDWYRINCAIKAAVAGEVETRERSLRRW